MFLDDYEKSLLTVGKFDTVRLASCYAKLPSDSQVEGFARYFNNIRLPSQLARNSNYHLFKNGIRPVSVESYPTPWLDNCEQALTKADVGRPSQR